MALHIIMYWRSLAWFEAHSEFQTVGNAANELWDKMITADERALT